MKQIKHFDHFYQKTIKLNPKRLKRLETHVKSVKNFLSKSDYGTRILSFEEQGSWRHNTIIQPLAKKEYDADLLIMLKRSRNWKVSDYLDNLYKTLRASPVYKNKVSRKTRCITVDYAGDFHLDLVPCLHDKTSQFIFFPKSKFYICNRHERRFERTDGTGYTDWLDDKKKTVHSNMLIKTIQILKYLRDHKQTFSVKSILLTTLIGNCIEEYESHKNFKDLPSSLQTILHRLDNFLTSNETIPIIKNPAYRDENFNRKWEDINYQNFRRCIQSLRLRVDDAIAEPKTNASMKKWRSLLGPSFGKN